MPNLPAGFSRAANGFIYKDDGTGPYLFNADGSASQGLPKKLMTDGDGVNARLRVDVAQTGFFSGREFRSFLRLNIAAMGVLVVRATVPLNIILFKLEAAIQSGELDVSTQVGGTPGGSFNVPLAIFRTNNMSSAPQPPYVGQVVLESGGTLAGGTEISALHIKANNNTNQAGTVGASGSDERGVAAGTYYFVFTNNSAADAVVGLFDVRWEERP